MDTSEKKSLVKSALHFASGTMASRAFGIIREIAMATFFGTHPLLASWLVAFRASHLLRRIVGEGGLSNGFIPYFERLRLESEKKAAIFFRDVFLSVLLFLVGSVLFFEGCLYFGGKYFFNSTAAEIGNLAMIMIPSLISACLYALGMALMQCHKKYFLAAAAPIAYNILWIIGIFWAKNLPMEQVVIVLSITTSLGLVGQWLLTTPFSFKYLKEHLGAFWWRGATPFSPDIRAMLGAMMLTLVGIGAMQINSVIDLIFAKISSPQGPAYLTYAARWTQLPLALCGIAVSSAIFPPLSRAVAAEEGEKIRTYLGHAIGHTLHLLLFATLFLFIVGGALMSLFFGHGQFALEAIWKTKAAIIGYGWGLIPSGLVTVFAVMFYAKKEFKTPLIASLISIFTSALLNVLFVTFWGFGPESIAYATSIAGCINCFYLGYKLKDQLFSIPSLVTSVKKAIGIVSIFSFFFFATTLFCPEHFSFLLWESIAFDFGPNAIFIHVARMVGFCLFYLLVIRVLRISEWKEIFATTLPIPSLLKKAQ